MLSESKLGGAASNWRIVPTELGVGVLMCCRALSLCIRVSDLVRKNVCAEGAHVARRVLVYAASRSTGLILGQL